MQSPLERFVARMDALVLALSGGLLAAMVAIVTLNVVTRYLLQVSLTWSSELARYLLVWSALLAAAALVRRRGHLAVDVLERRMSQASRRRLAVVAAVLSLTFFAALFVSGVLLVVGARGQASPSMESLPMSAAYAVIPISALWMCIGSVAGLQRAVGDREPEQ